MVRAAVYAYLIFCQLSLGWDTLRSLEAAGYLKSDILRLGIRTPPTEIGNLLASAACVNRFGRDALIQSGIFYSYDRTGSPCNCLEWRSDCVCDLESWRIDIDPRHSERGFILPVCHPDYLYIKSLRLFRNANDAHGFILRVRTDERNAA